MADGKTRSVSVVFQALTDKFTSKTKGAGQTIGGFAKKALLIGGAFMAARAGVRSFTEAFQKLDDLGKLSDSLEVTPNFLRGLDLAATQTGSSFATAQKGLQKFVRSIGEAKAGTGEGIKGLEMLGLTLQDLEGLNTEQQFLKVVEAIKNIEDPATKAAAAAKLMGRGAQDMINLFALGKDGLAAFNKEAEELGGPISREDIALVEQANDAVDKMGRAWEGVIQQLSIELAPVLTIIAESMTELIKLAKEFKDSLSSGLTLFGNIKIGKITIGTVEDKNKKGKSPIVPAVKISKQSIRNFSDAVSAGSSAAFNALNPNSTNSVPSQTLEEQKQQTKLLSKIAAKGRTTFKQVSA